MVVLVFLLCTFLRSFSLLEMEWRGLTALPIPRALPASTQLQREEVS